MVRKILLFTLACFVIVTLVAVFANLGDSSSAPANTTKRPGTSATVSTTAPTTEPPTTEPPTTTVPPVTTAPPEPELTPGQELVGSMRGWYCDALGERSYVFWRGKLPVFSLEMGHTGGAFVPIDVPEDGIYSITFEVEDYFSGVDHFLMYIRNGFGDPYEGFVTENFYKGDSILQLDLALCEGSNEVFLWSDGAYFDITSVTYEKVADYDIAITEFTGSGTGASVLYSGNPRLTYEEGNDVSDAVIRSEKFTVSEDGEYDLSFIAGAKCCPVVRICDSGGTVVKTIDCAYPWNSYGVNPEYNNQSTIYVPPVTVELTAGEYTIEVAFGDLYEHQDAILVHSAYLTKK